jgi:Flp pilus assembly protein TadG
MRRERGSVTAEAAVVLPAIVLVIAALVGAITVVTAQLRCQDGAREAARAAARSETPEVVAGLARRAAPDGSVVTVTSAGDQITVTVQSRVHILGGLLPSMTVTGRAVALAEPSDDDLGGSGTGALGVPSGGVPRSG